MDDKTKAKLNKMLNEICAEFDNYTVELEDDSKFWDAVYKMRQYIERK